MWTRYLPHIKKVQEILNDKIYLDNTGNVAIADGAPDLDQILQEPGPDFNEL